MKIYSSELELFDRFKNSFLEEMNKTCLAYNDPKFIIYKEEELKKFSSHFTTGNRTYLCGAKQLKIDSKLDSDISFIKEKIMQLSDLGKTLFDNEEEMELCILGLNAILSYITLIKNLFAFTKDTKELPCDIIIYLKYMMEENVDDLLVKNENINLEEVIKVLNNESTENSKRLIKIIRAMPRQVFNDLIEKINLENVDLAIKRKIFNNLKVGFLNFFKANNHIYYYKILSLVCLPVENFIKPLQNISIDLQNNQFPFLEKSIKSPNSVVKKEDLGISVTPRVNTIRKIESNRPTINPSKIVDGSVLEEKGNKEQPIEKSSNKCCSKSKWFIIFIVVFVLVLISVFVYKNKEYLIEKFNTI